MVSDSAEILRFWFSDVARPYWFRRNAQFDETLRERFLSTQQAATRGDLAHWTESPTGTLALVIVLDQLPRNLFRGTPAAFACDAQARHVAHQALTQGFDEQLPAEQRSFLYMPFMHSEDLADQQRSLALFQAAGLEANLPHAQQHHDIIARFGRFPHRNHVLGRESSAEEQRYLQTPGAFHG